MIKKALRRIDDGGARRFRRLELHLAPPEFAGNVLGLRLEHRKRLALERQRLPDREEGCGEGRCQERAAGDGYLQSSLVGDEVLTRRRVETNMRMWTRDPLLAAWLRFNKCRCGNQIFPSPETFRVSRRLPY